jgi:hypothetical protein
MGKKGRQNIAATCSVLQHFRQIQYSLALPLNRRSKWNISGEIGKGARYGALPMKTARIFSMLF